jgi:hypothetical protein
MPHRDGEYLSTLIHFLLRTWISFCEYCHCVVPSSFVLFSSYEALRGVVAVRNRRDWHAISLFSVVHFAFILYFGFCAVCHCYCAFSFAPRRIRSDFALLSLSQTSASACHRPAISLLLLAFAMQMPYFLSAIALLMLYQPSLCHRSANALPSLCHRLVIVVLSLCFCFATALPSLRYRSAIALLLLCHRLAIALLSLLLLCRHFAIALPYNPTTHSIHSHTLPHIHTHTHYRIAHITFPPAGLGPPPPMDAALCGAFWNSLFFNNYGAMLSLSFD